MRPRILAPSLLLALALLPPASAEQSCVIKARLLLDRVAGRLGSLKDGDVSGANRHIQKINQAKDSLKGCADQGTSHWAKQAERANALDAQVRAKAGGEGAPPAAAASGGAPKGSPPPSESTARLSTDDGYKFRRDFGERFPGYQRQLEGMDPRELASDHEVRKLKDAAARMRSALQALSAQGHPEVQGAYTQLAAFEEAVDAKAAEGRRLVSAARDQAAAEASAVDQELGAIEAFFDPKSFDCELKAPFTVERVEEWVGRLREYEAMQGKGVAQLDRVVARYPRYQDHPRIRSLRYVFTDVLPRKIQDGIARTTDWFQMGANSRVQGSLLTAMEQGERLTKPGAVTDRLLADDAWVESSLETVDAAEQAARAMLAFQKAYHGRGHPEAARLLASLKDTRERLYAGARRVLEASRMPPARSTSPELTRIATQTLETPKYGVGPYRRMVINADKKRHEQDEAEAKLEGDTIKIWKWTEVWDQFQVCLAEEVEGELRKVFYTLEYMHQAPRWKPVGRWYVAARLVSQRILPENVDQ